MISQHLNKLFILRAKLGKGWKSGWNHYYYPVSSDHWISVEVIKPSISTHVGMLSGGNGIFGVDSGSSESKMDIAYKEFFKMAVNALADLLGLPNFADPLFDIGESKKGSYTVQISGDVASDVKKITIKFCGDSRFRGTDYGAGVTWIITNPQNDNYKFKVSGGATLYVAGYSHNSVPIIPERKDIVPSSIIWKNGEKYRCYLVKASGRGCKNSKIGIRIETLLNSCNVIGPRRGHQRTTR